MTLNQSSLDLLSAYSLLFDSSINFSVTVLKKLQPDELKIAFRKKALATHPDRSMMLGRTEEELQVRFQEVSNAYEVLKFYVSGKTISTPANQEKSKTKSKGGHFSHGVLPERRLKIGQYLYYSQMISWQELIDAIVWQKKQRPLFGQIAKDWGYLTSEDIMTIIHQKKYHDRFGDYALRHGYLTSFQQMAVAGRQRLCQPLIGRHFIQKGVFTESRMNILNRQALVHNMKFGSRRTSM
ncbi:MAG: DnaJ domain-containing protein [Pseudomonadota bacterium]